MLEKKERMRKERRNGIKKGVAINKYRKQTRKKNNFKNQKNEQMTRRKRNQSRRKDF